MTPKTFTEAMQDEEFQDGYANWLVFYGWPQEEDNQDVLQEQSNYGRTPDKGEEIGYD
jgi:hypothetical protein